MTAFDIYSAIGGVDEDMLEETEAPLHRKINIRPAAAIAACLVIFIAGVYFFRKDADPHGPDISLVAIDGRLSRPYKNVNVLMPGSAVLWQWEYETIYEQYRSITVDGKSFMSRAREVDSSFLGDVIGSYEAEGDDIYTDQIHRKMFEVRKIKGVSDDLMVAVDLDGKYYVFMNEEYDPPASFGELLDSYDLADTVGLNDFTVYDGYDAKGYYCLNDDDFIWQTLSLCRDAKVIADADPWFEKGNNYIGFTVTSEALGIYKKGFCISEDGYLWTNIIEWEYIYYIGEKAANEIISYARERSEVSEPEPYSYFLAGTLTEIGDGYILVDDSIRCIDPGDGMVFRIPTDDIRIRRYIDTQTIRVGDIIGIHFTDNIDTAADNTVNGAYYISSAIIYDGAVMIEE